MKTVSVLLLLLAAIYGISQKNEAIQYHKIALEYYNHYCDAESLLIQANLSDPIVLEFRRNAKKDKFCDGFVIQ